MLTDRYSKRFPEMASLNLGPLDYARVVLEIGETSDLTQVDYGKVLPPTLVLAMAMPASTTVGRVPSSEALVDVLMLARTVIDMYTLQRTFLEFLESRMARIAPNVTAIVGTTIAAQLLGATGSIEVLAKTPAGNIMVIGRQRQKELAGFSLAASNPHAGFIFASDLVTQTPLAHRTQAQRLLANKLALAARLDCQRQSMDGAYGRQLRGEIIVKLEKLIEPAPATRAKPIPPPPIEASKKRGGKRARKQKELYAQTKVRRMANRMEFGKAEEEIIVGDKVLGLGELSGLVSGSSLGSQIRAPVLDNKLREHLKRQSQKTYARFLLPTSTPTSASITTANGNNKSGASSTSGTMRGATTTVSGTATSMTITPGEGIKLETRHSADPNLASTIKARYLGSNMSFRK